MVEFGLMFVIRIVIFCREFFLELIMIVFEFVGFIIILLVNGVISYKKKIRNKRFFVENFCYSKLFMICKWIIVNIWMFIMYLFKFI